MGTPDFAVSSLKALYDAGHDIAAVFTQPDKPVGRRQIMTPSAVKIQAEALRLKVFSPVNFRDGTAYEILSGLSPDIIIVAAYGKLLPPDVLELPACGCINVHGSLLPAYRGAAPIQWSVINGEKFTGVTIMQMNAGLDTGDILLQRSTEIGENETAPQLYYRLSRLGADALLDALPLIEDGSLNRTPQDDSLASYAPPLTKSMGLIDFNDTAENIHNKIRGMCGWPVAYTTINGKTLKVFESRICTEKGEAGTLLCRDSLKVGCRDSSIEFLSVQLEGKKRLDAHQFLMGCKLSAGDRIGI